MPRELLDPQEKRKRKNACDTAWNRQHTKVMSLKFNLNTDQDIVQHIATVGSFQTYIKKLIRADIEQSKTE